MFDKNMVQSGSFVVAATPAAVEIELGFKPSYVKAINQTDVTIYEHFDGMASPSALKTANHASAQFAVATTNTITIADNGFTLGTAIGDTAADVVRWVAFR